jgi:hypothetical protein
VSATRDLTEPSYLAAPGSWDLIRATRCSMPGAAVICVDNFCTGRRENIAHLTEAARFELVPHNVTNPLPDLEPLDVIFHLACAASPCGVPSPADRTLRAGSLGTEHGLQLAERYGLGSCWPPPARCTATLRCTRRPTQPGLLI